MEANSQEVAYLVFDIETAINGQLVSDTRYRGQGLSPDEAVARYAEERVAKTGSDFIPHNYHFPIAIVVAKVDAAFQLLDVVALDDPEYRPDRMTEIFWKGWNAYDCPTLVTFNGRGFDLPVLELAAFHYAIDVHRWFADGARTYEQPRNRFNVRSHIDLQDFFTNYGATRFEGGLDLAARLIGNPGKMTSTGSDVHQLHQEGRSQDIVDYCQCDVLDTYFVFLRTRVLLGLLEPEIEIQTIEKACGWIEHHLGERPALKQYLQEFRDCEGCID